MRGLAGVVVVAATVLASAPAASAGTYNVVSCRAPGAGGVNAAWTPFLSSFNSTAQPEAFSFESTCPGASGQLSARSAAHAGQVAFWSHSGSLRFTAPPGTSITKLIVWRWGQMVKTDAGVYDWRVYGETDDGRIPWKAASRATRTNAGLVRWSPRVRSERLPCRVRRQHGLSQLGRQLRPP
jgi:hypothetical protein